MSDSEKIFLLEIQFANALNLQPLFEPLREFNYHFCLPF